jgi:hypothetical protein
MDKCIIEFMVSHFLKDVKLDWEISEDKKFWNSSIFCKILDFLIINMFALLWMLDKCFMIKLGDNFSLKD